MRPGNSYTGGMSTYTYQHTVENGAGERITFVRRVRDPAGDRLEVENHLKPGSGSLMNIHNPHPSPARRRGFFVPCDADVENRVLGGTGVEPTQTSSRRRRVSSSPRPTTTRLRSSSPTPRRACCWPATPRQKRSNTGERLLREASKGHLHTETTHNLSLGSVPY
jgi:hypothetical protein